MELWEQWLITFGGQAALLTVLGFLFRSLIGQMLTKDIEKYKTELKAEGDTSIEKLRSALQIVAIEHQTRFSKLHEKRAQVVADLYEKVVTAYWACHTYHQWWELSGGPTQEEQGTAALKSLHEAYRLFEVNRIYLAASLSDELDGFFDRAKMLTVKVQYFDNLPVKNKTDHALKLYHEARSESLKAFEKEFPAMRKRLDGEFKRLLEPKTQTAEASERP